MITAPPIRPLASARIRPLGQDAGVAGHWSAWLNTCSNRVGGHAAACLVALPGAVRQRARVGAWPGPGVVGAVPLRAGQGRAGGPEGLGARHDSVSDTDTAARPPEPADPSEEPAQLASWSEFHQCVEALP